MATGHYIGVASKKITLTNLVPAMSSLSFAVGSSSGTCEMSTAHTKYGSTALCNTGVAGYNEMYALSSQKFQLIPDHFYYACVEVYQETKLGSIDYFWPSGSPSIFGGQATGNAGTWKKLSNVTTRSSFTSGDYPIRLDFNNGGTAGKAWFDGLMLIDLTEAFGAGNEPGNAWCQENIPYFTGTTTVERYTESGVARKVVSSYIGVEGVARKVTSGYVGVDGVARLFFAPESGNVVLEVEKITSNTYANETTYENEEFILLNIYPKTGGTVNVTYGGLTKTITDTSGAEVPNGKTVFFGTFNGATDSVPTPSSGELTIDGDYRCFGCGSFNTDKTGVVTWSGITGIIEWGNSETIGRAAFSGCDKVTISELPAGVKTIGDGAFNGCDKVTISELPAGVKTIGMNAFRNSNFVLGPNFFGSEIVSIGPYAFSRDTKITGTVDIILPETLTELGEMVFSIASIAGTRYAIFDGTVTLLAKTPPTIVVSMVSTTTEPIGPFGSAASDNPNITIIVPKGCGEAYKAADGWSEYANHIVEAT